MPGKTIRRKLDSQASNRFHKARREHVPVTKSNEAFGVSIHTVAEYYRRSNGRTSVSPSSGKAVQDVAAFASSWFFAGGASARPRSHGAARGPDRARGPRLATIGPPAGHRQQSQPNL